MWLPALDGEIGLPPGKGRIRASVESRSLDEELRGYVTRVRCKARKVTYFGTARISAGPVSVSGKFVARAFQRRNGNKVVRLPIFYSRSVLGQDLAHGAHRFEQEPRPVVPRSAT